MKYLLIILVYASLAVLLVSSVLFYLDQISFLQIYVLMFSGALIWLVSSMCWLDLTDKTS